MQLSTETSGRLLRLLDFCLEINSEHNLNSLIELLVTKIPTVLGAERGTLLIHDASRAELWSRIAGGLDAGEEIRIPEDAGLAGACFGANDIVNVPDAYRDDRFNAEVDQQTGFKTTSILSLPLRDRHGLAKGVLQVMNKPGGFSREDEEFCTLLAAQVAISVESTRSFEQLRHEQDRLTVENRRLRDALRKQDKPDDLVGSSPAFRQVIDRIRQVAPTTTTVLVTGETGTGKELIARLLHDQSPRAGQPFVAINCSAVPDQLLESELFGYERGAFTGAVGRKEGLFESAEGGTVFLDEIGEMPIELQAKLLRVLQESEVRRLGSTVGRKVDVRIVAATNRSLRDMVKEGKFREDLYYRLNVVPTELPPLRDRAEDIPLLTAAFLGRFAKRHGKPEPRFSPEAMDCLLRYAFPGNIRELENTIERMVVLSQDSLLSVADLPPEMRIEAGGETDQVVPRTNDELKQAKKEARERAQLAVERRFIEYLLRSTSGKVTQAAKEAAMNRSLLQQMMARHGLNADNFRGPSSAE